jgi:predicted nuclease with TOPRIM domain
MKLNANPAELKKILEENRANHEEIYKKAMEKYREAKAELEDFQASINKKLEKLQDKYKGIAEGLRFYYNLPKPEKHLKDYDRIIKILSLEKHVEIELTEQEVAMYVMNEWSWTQAFTTNTVNYLAKQPDDEQ